MKKAMLWAGLVLLVVVTQGGYGMATAQNGKFQGQGPKDVVGAWVVRGATDIQGQFNSLMTFHADGTMSADEPSAHETTGHGSWTRQGPSRYAYTFMAFIGGPAGEFNGTIKVVGTLDLSGGTWDGPFRVEVFDPSAAVIFSDAGRFRAREITVER